MNPKVSIIVPIYNVEKYLAECVDSLIGQTYENTEVILVDDGSKDSSGRICDEYTSEFPDKYIKVVHKENGGLVSAWKAGVEASTGEYLSFVDGDDWVDMNMIAEMTAKATGSEYEIISSDYVIEYSRGGGKSVYQRLTPGEYDRVKIEKEVIPHLLGNEQRLIHVSRCMKLFSRKLFLDNIKYSDEKLRMGEDFIVTIPCFLDAQRIYVMDHKAYYHYRYVNESMVHKYDPNLEANIERLFNDACVMLEDKSGKSNALKGMRAVLKEELDKEYIYHLMLLLKNEARNADKSAYIGNMQKIARNGANKKLISDLKIEIDEKANKLVYFVLQHPTNINCRMLHTAMDLKK